MMRKTALFILIFTLYLSVMPYSILAAESDQVYIIPLKDEITPAMSAYLADQIELAESAGAKGIIIEISLCQGPGLFCHRDSGCHSQFTNTNSGICEGSCRVCRCLDHHSC